MTADRLSKIAVVVWAVAALVAEVYFAAPGWWALRTWVPLLFAGAAALAIVEPRTVGALVVAPYLFPAFLFLTARVYHVHYTTAWFAAMLGFILPDALRRGWHAPPAWRVGLACWAGVIAVTAPIIVLRNIDFHFDLLTRGRMPTEILGGVMLQTLGWIGHVALSIVIGILWFDWLLSLDDTFLRRWVISPLAGATLLLTMASLYQMTVDIGFLNPTVYAVIHRATGTLFDANAAGAVTAMWIGGWMALAEQERSRAWWAIAAIGIVLCWAAVWASASRTALLAAVIVTFGSAAVLLASRVKRPRIMMLTCAIVSLCVVAGGFALWRRPDVQGPIGRLRAMVTSVSSDPQRLAESLWNRDGYGLAATRMIARYPLFGIGIGSFQEMALEFAGSLPPDNAQNWFRHQLAETGIVGSLGWMLFVGTFGWSVLRVRRDDGPAAWTLRVMILAFLLVSLVGMPSQDPAAAFTFWTIAAWFTVARGRSLSARRVPIGVWIGALVVVVASGAGTASLAAGRLRLPVRIQRAANTDLTDYTYGLSWEEQDGAGPFRWARRQSTTLVPVQGQILNVGVSVNFVDLVTRPVHAKVWVDGRLEIDQPLTIEQPLVTKAVLLPAGERRVLIDTATDRTVTAPDGRELGLQVRWRFETPRR